jgi:hypothetical protein
VPTGLDCGGRILRTAPTTGGDYVTYRIIRERPESPVPGACKPPRESREPYPDFNLCAETQRFELTSLTLSYAYGAAAGNLMRHPRIVHSISSRYPQPKSSAGRSRAACGGRGPEWPQGMRRPVNARCQARPKWRSAFVRLLNFVKHTKEPDSTALANGAGKLRVRTACDHGCETTAIPVQHTVPVQSDAHPPHAHRT